MMRNLVGKNALRVFNDVLGRILALSDKTKRFRGRVVTKLYMRVRRGKMFQIERKKEINYSNSFGEKNNNRLNNLEQFRIQGLPTFPTQSRNFVQLLKKEKIPFHVRKY